jgi:methylated-DNA-[protein]-cysteine S-methyltransferase
MTARATSLPTPMGDLLVAADDTAVIGCWFGQAADFSERLGLDEPLEWVDSLGEFSDAVAAYLDGDVKAIDGLPVRQPGPEFRQRCWEQMRAVPAGETISYTTLAERSGNPRAVRAAGSACARNLIAVIVPCHRIVTSAGLVGGYAYGVDAKRWLLALERGQGALG